MDHAAGADEEAAIKQTIAENAHGSLGVHDLKTRRAGQAIFIEFHLVVPARMAVALLCRPMSPRRRSGLPR